MRERVTNAELDHERRERRGLNVGRNPDGTYRVEAIVAEKVAANCSVRYR